ncbi:MAG: competence/damage-inducible protein A [Nitrospiria bacterium]
MNSKKAAIIIIGNEVLSAKVNDVNSPFLARELRSLGVSVERITVIPDDVETIAEAVSEGRRRYDLIFTCGGIGPTHDDVTMAGIALGLGRPLIRHKKLLALMTESGGPTINAARLKMTEVPEGTELIFSEMLRVPVIHVEQIYIFPGIPELVQKKFNAIKERFREAPFHLVKLYLSAGESAIAADLETTLTRFPDLQLGSYPALKKTDHKILLTLESKEKTYLDAALSDLLHVLPDEAIVKIDPPPHP